MSAAPEVQPLRTSDPVFYELRPVARVADQPPSDTTHEWVRVRALGERLTAIVHALNYSDMREIRRIADTAEQSDEVLRRARVEVMFKREPCPEHIAAIPELHMYSLVGKITTLSATGVDPFTEAPADSPP